MDISKTVLTQAVSPPDILPHINGIENASDEQKKKLALVISDKRNASYYINVLEREYPIQLHKEQQGAGIQIFVSKSGLKSNEDTQ